MLESIKMGKSHYTSQTKNINSTTNPTFKRFISIIDIINIVIK